MAVKRQNKTLNHSVRNFNAVAIRIAALVIFIAVLVGVIGYARGYRPDFKTRSISSTGIIAIASYPQAAKVYINGSLKGVTNMNLTLPPGEYVIELKKEGYTDWRKKITLKGEVVITLDGLLFPKNPSLSPLTSLGITRSIPINQGNKMILSSENNDPEKDGLYIFEVNKRPLSLLPPLKRLLLKKYLPQNIDLQNMTVDFSPDHREGIFEFKLKDEEGSVSYLLSLDDENTQPFDITASKETLLTAWKEEKNKEVLKILETFPKEIIKVASDSIRLVSLSPDETKILYQVTKPLTLPPVITPPLIGASQSEEKRSLQPELLYVYDRKEDKNFEVTAAKLEKIKSLSPLEELLLNEGQNSILWYPDSRHFVIREQKEIIVIDYDGDNKRTIYSGPFQDGFFNITEQGKLIILTNLNPQNNISPDVYEVGIR